MFCRYCGEKIPDTSKTCRYCGRSLSRESSGTARGSSGTARGSSGTARRASGSVSVSLDELIKQESEGEEDFSFLPRDSEGTEDLFGLKKKSASGQSQKRGQGPAPQIPPPQVPVPQGRGRAAFFDEDDLEEGYFDDEEEEEGNDPGDEDAYLGGRFEEEDEEEEEELRSYQRRGSTSYREQGGRGQGSRSQPSRNYRGRSYAGREEDGAFDDRISPRERFSSGDSFGEEYEDDGPHSRRAGRDYGGNRSPFRRQSGAPASILEDSNQLILLGITLLAFLCSIPVVRYSNGYLFMISSICLGVLIVMRKRYTDVLMAIPLTVMSLYYLINWFDRYRSYVSYTYNLQTISRFVLYALVILYWLVVLNLIHNRKVSYTLLFVFLALNIVLLLLGMLLNARVFTNACFYIQQILILSVYLVLIYLNEKQVVFGQLKEWGDDAGRRAQDLQSRYAMSVANREKEAAQERERYQREKKAGGDEGVFHPYHLLSGWLALFTIGAILTGGAEIFLCSLLGSMDSLLGSLSSLSGFSSDLGELLGYLGMNGLPPIWPVTLLFGAAGVFYLWFALDIFRRKASFLVRFHCAMGFELALVIYLLVVLGKYNLMTGDMISTLISQVIRFVVMTLYFTRSVRVRTYMGTDEYFRKDIFTRSLPSPLSMDGLPYRAPYKR